MFTGVIRLATRCQVCGLDLSREDTGDSFVVPTLIVLGAIITVAAIAVDFAYRPPLWVHALIWPPITVILALVMTRFLKSFFIVEQYRTRRDTL